MNCPNCNVGIADGATFCFDCNTKIPVEAIGQQNPAVAAAGTGDRVGSLSLGRIDAGRSTAGGVGTNRQRALAVLPGSPSTRRSPAPSSSATGVSAEIKGTLASGADELSTLASKDGYELLAMVGLSQHGKSEFMYSFLKTITQSRGRDQAQAGGVMNRGAGPESVRRTDPGNYYGWRVPVRDRLFVVWDIAGEDFESIADQRALRVKFPAKAVGCVERSRARAIRSPREARCQRQHLRPFPGVCARCAVASKAWHPR